MLYPSEVRGQMPLRVCRGGTVVQPDDTTWMHVTARWEEAGQRSSAVGIRLSDSKF